MSSIEKFDKNLAVESNIKREGLSFYSVEQEPFKIYGVFKEDGVFRRMPRTVAEQVNEGVLGLSAMAAGGRVRFVTDSPYVAVKAKCDPCRMPHFALTGVCGFDMFAEYGEECRYVGTFVPPNNMRGEFEGVLDFTEPRERLITINLSLYGTVYDVWIGLKEGCSLKPAPEYQYAKPVVFYGSSITQGGCASKPGCSYQSILSRRLQFDYINLGFSGSARGEDAMTDYINSLDMSVFVMDYDHNAPTTEHLKATHSRMFAKIRAAHPDLPILIMPRPKYYLTEEEKLRHEIVYGTYKAAKDSGDENVYFISGRELMELAGDLGTVDNCHPTDLGFYSMAKAIEPVLRKIL